MKEDVRANWNVKDNVALRIALFFELTGINFSKFEQEILKRDGVFANINEIRNTFVKSLFLYIDDLFTPLVIASLVKQKKSLSGNSAQKRYASFFLTKDLCWQGNALKIKQDYPFLNMLRMTHHLIQPPENRWFLFCFQALARVRKWKN